MYQVDCPACQQVIEMSDLRQGQVFSCPKCAHPMSIAHVPVATVVEPVDSPKHVFENLAEEAAMEDDHQHAEKVLGEMPRPLPADIHHFGKLHVGYKSDTNGKYIHWVGGVSVFLLILLLSRVVPMIESKGIGAALLLIAVVLPFLVFCVVILFLWLRPTRILVYDRGLLYQCGRKFRVVPGEEIWSVEVVTLYLKNRVDLSIRKEYVLTIRWGKDGIVEFSRGEEKVPALATWIKQVAVANQLESTLEQLRGGNTLRFGPLTLYREGVRHGERVYPWDTLADCEILQDKLCFRQKLQRNFTLTLNVGAVTGSFLVVPIVKAMIVSHS